MLSRTDRLPLTQRSTQTRTEHKTPSTSSGSAFKGDSNHRSSVLSSLRYLEALGLGSRAVVDEAPVRLHPTPGDVVYGASSVRPVS
jgi:hypothetical protein